MTFFVYILFQDVDTYKNSTKDEIMNWITTLKKCAVPHDWMVILVESPDSRKTSKALLPRSSVLDKLRTDIGTKNADRCFSLLGKFLTARPNLAIQKITNITNYFVSSNFAHYELVAPPSDKLYRSKLHIFSRGHVLKIDFNLVFEVY